LIASIAIETGISPREIEQLDMEMFYALVRVINNKYDN
jgi:hypothetical protein